MPATDAGLSLQFARCAYVIIIMAIYWCTDVIPVAVTSLLPVLLFPLLQILDSKEVSRHGVLATSSWFSQRLFPFPTPL